MNNITTLRDIQFDYCPSNGFITELTNNETRQASDKELEEIF